MSDCSSLILAVLIWAFSLFCTVCNHRLRNRILLQWAFSLASLADWGV